MTTDFEKRVHEMHLEAKRLVEAFERLEHENGGKLPGRYTSLAWTEAERVEDWLRRACNHSEGYVQPGGED